MIVLPGRGQRCAHVNTVVACAVASTAGFAGEDGGSGFCVLLVLPIPAGFVWCVLASPGLVIRRGEGVGLTVACIPIIALEFFLLALPVIDALF